MLEWVGSWRGEQLPCGQLSVWAIDEEVREQLTVSNFRVGKGRVSNWRVGNWRCTEKMIQVNGHSSFLASNTRMRTRVFHWVLFLDLVASWYMKGLKRKVRCKVCVCMCVWGGVCVIIHSFREANKLNISHLLSLEPFKQFLVVWWGVVVWWCGGWGRFYCSA